MRALFSIALLAFGAVLSGLPQRAQGQDGSIGVYADVTATQTSTVFALGVPRTLFIIATLEGQTAGGMAGAEFRIDGMPEDWLVFVSPNPAANITLGDPFRVLGTTHRANIAFPGCTAGTDGRVLLYTVNVIAQSAIEPRDLSVEVGNPPTSPLFTTPVIQRCDAPNYTSVPMPRTTFRMETRAPHDLDYSQLPGYDGIRGAKPEVGMPGEMFRFRVSYSSNDALPPQAGSPRVELDANGDDDTDDPFDAAWTMSPADQDSTLGNGKEYRFDVALGEPPGGHYRYRFSALDAHGATVPGVATAWRDLTVDDDLADVAVYAEDIRFSPTLQPGQLGSVMVRVHNRSDRRVDGVRVRVESQAGDVFVDRLLASIGPRSSTEVAGNVSFSAAGYQVVIASVDPVNQIPEADESNNHASQGVLLEASGVWPGALAVVGIPTLISVPPIAPFAFTGRVEHVTQPLTHALMRGGTIVTRPSWDSATSARVDGAGGFLASLIAPAAPGTYPLTFVASDGSRSDSVTINVSVAPLPGGSQPHLPNLVLQIQATADVGCPATAATLSATVVNTGDRASDPTTVRLLQNGVTVVTELPLAALVPGQSVTIGPVQATLASSGLHAFTAHADPGSTVKELREDDNASVATVRVAPDCLDLALESMRYTTFRMCLAEPIGVAIRIANRGCVTSQPARVVLRADGIEIANAPLAALAPGATADLEMSHVFPTSVCPDIVFALDPEGTAGDDCDLASNDLSAGLCVGNCNPAPPPPPPNLRILACDVHALDAHPVNGSQVRFEAWVENTSDQSVPALPVSFEIDGSVLGGWFLVGPWTPHERSLVQTVSTWTVDYAVHTLTVDINPNRSQPESNFGDNVATRVLPWDLRPKFIPRCPPADPSMFSTCNPCLNAPFDIRAVVVNDGLFDCDSATVEFRDVTLGNISIGRAVSRGLTAGNECSATIQPVSIEHRLQNLAVHSFEAVVDPDNVLGERDETNNRYQQSLQATCGEIPDLVSAVRLPIGIFPQPGDTITAVEVTVRNIGGALASNVLARLKLDGATLCDLSMGNIAADSSSTVVCTTPWVVATNACSQRLEACADPFNAIGELNESNNCATNGISGGPDTDLAIFPWTIRVTPPSPLPGQQVLIEVGMYSFNGVESSCDLIVEWSPTNDTWLQIGSVIPLHLPPSQQLFPNVATLVFTPPFLPVGLRFRLVNICPYDINTSNNIAVGELPWFSPPNTPVFVTDLEARSTPEGVVVRWKAEPGAEAFVLERHREGESSWDRLPNRIPAAPSGGLVSYEAIDRDAEPEARLEYRLIGIVPGGNEEVLGQVSVVHDAAAVRSVQLHPVRPNPFRPGGALEYSLPERRDVQLSVFDAAGRRVASLRNGSQTAGRHAATWDGRDDSGRDAPAGIYFCQLRADGFQQIRRFVLLH